MQTFVVCIGLHSACARHATQCSVCQNSQCPAFLLLRQSYWFTLWFTVEKPFVTLKGLLAPYFHKHFGFNFFVCFYLFLKLKFMMLLLESNIIKF